MLETKISQSNLRGSHLIRAVSRETSQSGAIFPVLLGWRGLKVVLVSGMVSSVMSEIMEGALGKIRAHHKSNHNFPDAS